MCDFFSAVILADGRVLHDETNSHSGIAERNNLRPNTQERIRFWEFEWNGTGAYLPARHLRNQAEAPLEVQEAAAKLAAELADAFAGKFSLRMKGWADVRREVAWNPATLPATLAALASDPDAYVRYWVAGNPNTPKA